MSVELIREYWSYHHWANRRLYDVVAALGDDAAGRPIGKQFSEPSLRAMLVHMYGADWFWLETWRGRPPSFTRGDPTYGLKVGTLGELRPRWDTLRPTCGDRSTARPPEGRTFSRPLGMLLLHVPTHAAHHRSELATMLTMVRGSPPDTGINSFYREKSAGAV
ncbi:MAG: hypothetical protein DME05_27090 [Candidatus Rokuibacteriota bacterium]|nr:MAG: hypothetical protein DME05_27090 [Candidatus Rokubacteria bacterium]